MKISCNHQDKEICYRSIISDNRTLIMGMAMLSVMFFHQPWFYGHGLDNFFYYFGYWGVDFFLFVSGFGIANSLNMHSIVTYYKNRIKRLVPYCLFFGAVRAILYSLGIHGFYIKFNPPVELVLCSLDLWFIEAILIYYCFAPVIQIAIKRKPLFVFFAVVVACSICHHIGKPDCFSNYLLLKKIPWIIDRLPVFVLGMSIYHCNDNIAKKKLLVTGIFWILCAMVIRVTPSPSFLKENILLFVCMATPGISLLVSRLRLFFEKIHLYGLLNWLGKNSLCIYLSHEFVYWAIFNHLNNLGRSLSFFLSSAVIGCIVWLCKEKYQ